MHFTLKSNSIVYKLVSNKSNKCIETGLPITLYLVVSNIYCGNVIKLVLASLKQFPCLTFLLVQMLM